MQKIESPSTGSDVLQRLEAHSAWHLLCILAIAFALRLMYVEWAQGNAFGYQSDSLEAFEVAAHFEAGDERTRYIGQPSWNTAAHLPGPLWTLFCVAGLKLGGSIFGILWLTVAFNLLAIALAWKLARNLFGLPTATLAALFLSISPWAVHFSAILYNPSPLPFFGALIFLALWRCLRQERSPAIFWLPLLILTGTQFHFCVLLLVPPIVALCWVARLKPRWSWLAAGFAAGSLCYLPYVFGDMAHGWENTRGLIFGPANKFSAGSLKAFSSPFTFLINYWDPGWTYGPGDYAALTRKAFGATPVLITVNVISVTCAALIFVGLVHPVRATLQNFRTAPHEVYARSPGLFTMVFLLLGYEFFYLILGRPFHARYCLLVLPLIFSLAGFGAVRCLASPSLKRVFLPVLIATVAANLWFVPVISRFERDRIEHGAIFVPGYAKLESIYRLLRARGSARIEVRTREYLASVPSRGHNNIYLHADLLRRYVAGRELEARAAGRVFQGTDVFEMRAAGLVNPTDPAVVFRGHGIALVAVPPEHL